MSKYQKNLSKKYVLHSDPNKKKDLLLITSLKLQTKYFPKCFPSTKLLDRKNVVYMFKRQLGDCVSKEKNAYLLLGDFDSVAL